MVKLLLERSYLPHCTLGKLSIENTTHSFCTMELPWLDNRPNVSCIPEGIYTLSWCNSPKIREVTKGKFNGGFEVLGVHGREHILIHPGNWPSNSKGCILIGKDHSLMEDPNTKCPYGVTHSQDTFSNFMDLLTSRNYQLEVTARHAGAV